jgi:hypothetical protein
MQFFAFAFEIIHAAKLDAAAPPPACPSLGFAGPALFFPNYDIWEPSPMNSSCTVG